MTQLKEILVNNLKVLPVARTDGGMPAEPARLINGRGGRAPGFEDINIDLYPPLVFVTIYCEYSDNQISRMADAIKSVLPGMPCLVQDRSVRPAVTRLQYGDVSGKFIVNEGGLGFYLNPLRGQNPGFFADMRDGRGLIRRLVGRYCAGDQQDVSVLNLFAYTCVLSVVSIAAGASKVVNIDKNRRSLDIGKENHRLNHSAIPGGYRNQAMFLPHDIFKSLGKLKKEGPYNLIIADPPPSQKGSFMLKADYPRLLRRLPEMLKPGGRLMLTLNSPGWLWEDFEAMVSESIPGCSVLERVRPPSDFAPAEDGRGLKILVVGC